MQIRRFTMLFAAAAMLAAAPAWAHDDDDHRRGKGHGHHGHGHGHGHGHHKHDDKHKHKQDQHKHKDKHDKHGHKHDKHEHQARPVVPAAPVQQVVVYPPWIVVQGGERVYHPQHQPRPSGNAFRCNSDTVGRVLGGIVGGALGSQIGKGNGRTLATVGGAVAGVLIGGEVGKRMDARDQACVGEVLEVAPVNRPVHWSEGPSQYTVVPGRVVDRQGSYCRPYTVEVQMEGAPTQRSQGTACRRADGVWVAA
ncbi:MAG TPA: glycine zipper 2TM domain-containing protein [Ramlibacter sp.]|nr:glycine zipper 2TM domain-containing protein [Ramlibacter sp.]